MYNIRRIIVILVILILVALMIQYFRIDFINLSQDDIVLNQEDILVLEKPAVSLETFLIVTDEHMATLTTSLVSCLESMKLNYEMVAIDDFKQAQVDYPYMVMCISDLEDLQDYDGFVKYIESGGRVFFPQGLSFGDTYGGFSRMIGITEFGEFDQAEGLNFEQAFMLGSSFLKPEDTKEVINQSIAIQLESNSEILLKSQDGFNLAWAVPVGQGQVVYFNGSMFQSGAHKGLLTALVNTLRETPLYPIVNSQINIIKRFPSPIMDGSHPAIEVYNRSALRFYKEIWLQDMLEMASRFNLSYTTGLMGTPDEFETSDTDYFFLKRENLSAFGREILSSGGEIGLTGFNNQPLTLDGWDNRSDMTNAMALIQDHFSKVFSNYDMITMITDQRVSDDMMTYLRQEGFLIFVADQLMNSDEVTTGLAVHDGYLEIPLLTTGYEALRWQLVNNIAQWGFVSHGIAFDDIFSGAYDLTWKDMYELYYDEMSFLYDKFRWMDHETVSESAQKAIVYENVYPTYIRQGDQIKVELNNSLGQINLVLYHDGSVTVQGGSVQQIDSDHYLIQSEADEVTINLGR